MDKQTSKLEQAKADYIEKLKKVKLLDAGIDYDDVDRYIKYIDADSEEEINRQANELADDINQQSQLADVYIDEHVWKPF